MHHCQSFQVVLFQLFQEIVRNFHAQSDALYTIDAGLEGLLQVVDEVGQRKRSSRVLRVSRVDKHEALVVDGILYESVGDSEMLLDVLLGVVVDVYSEVLEVLFPFGVLHSSDVENVCDSLFEEDLGSESDREAAQVNLFQDLFHDVGGDVLLVVDWTEGEMWESKTD